MRNLAQYPITAEEIVECVNRLKDEAQKRVEVDHICGDMTPLLLTVASQIVAKYGEEFLKSDS